MNIICVAVMAEEGNDYRRLKPEEMTEARRK